MSTVFFNFLKQGDIMHFMNKTAATINFGQNLRLVRRKKGYTLDRLAEISGISKRMISHYETRAKRPSLDKINILADALNVSIDELTGHDSHIKHKKNEDIVSYKIMKKLRVIERLSVREQKAIFQFINTIVEKNRYKKEFQNKKK
jgi:transcriptional regulator with XRE-family HTH domain